MLVQLLQKHGLQSRVESADAIGIFNVLRLETSGVAVVCLSYLHIGSPARVRYVIRRLRRRVPGVKIILGSWLAELDVTALGQAGRPDAIAHTLKDAVKICIDEARASPSQPQAAGELASGVDAA